MTTISPIKYEVEIHEPLSTPVPMPPSILSSEALVIWMLRIAMNEPIMAARTAIQTVTLARFGSTAARSGLAGSADSGADGARFAMALSSGRLVRGLRCGHRAAIPGLRFGLDGRDHRHARAQFDWRAVVAAERDLDGNALHHFCKIAGGVVRRQQREFLAAGGRDAVDMAVHDLAREHVDGDIARLALTHA